MVFSRAEKDQQFAVEPERRDSVTDAFLCTRRGSFDCPPKFLECGAFISSQRGEIIIVRFWLRSRRAFSPLDRQISFALFFHGAAGFAHLAINGYHIWRGQTRFFCSCKRLDLPKLSMRSPPPTAATSVTPISSCVTRSI